jgi:dihydrolipoamide dehydrogenase
MYDLIILGCGSGGIEAAKEALKYTRKIACIEKTPDEIGGTCLNRGCVPTKFLHEGAHLSEKIENAAFWGLEASLNNVNLVEAIKNAKEKVIKVVREATYKFLKAKGVEFIFSKNNRFIDENKLETEKGILEGKYFLIATGSRPSSVPGVVPDGEYILDTDSIWKIKETPKRLLIVGGGAAGVEFAYILKRLGVEEVHLVELMDRLLPTFSNVSDDLVRRLERALTKLGIDIRKKTVVEKIDKENKKVKLSDGITLEVDKVLLTVGRKPNTDNLNLEKIGIKLLRKGHIEVKNGYRTAVENIFAVGDVIPTPALAHVAKHEAILAVRNMFKNRSDELDYSLVPSVVHSAYQLGFFGLGEKTLKEKGEKFSVKMTTLRAVAKALSEKDEGVIKVFTSPEGNIFGANVLTMKNTNSLLHLLLLAKVKGMKVNELKEIVWDHPTVEEVLETLGGI